MKVPLDTLMPLLLSLVISLTILMPNKFHDIADKTSQPREAENYSDPIIRYGGNHAFLSISKISDRTFVITLSPLESIRSTEPEIPISDFLIDYPREDLWRSRTIMDPVRGGIGEYTLEILRSPLRVIFRREDDTIVQQLVWPDSDDGKLEFQAKKSVFGLNIDANQPDQMNQWFKLNTNDDHHSEMDFTPLFSGAEGWSIFITHPESIDNSLAIHDEKGIFLPDQEKLDLPVQIILTFWDEPDQIISEYSALAGEALMISLQFSDVKKIISTTNEYE